MQTESLSSRANVGQLIRAAEGLTQWRPLVLSFLSLLCTMALFAVAAAVGNRLHNSFGSLLGVLIGLLAVAVLSAGFSGAGVMLMDRAKQITPRSMSDAILFGFMCLPRFLGFALVLLALSLGLALVASLVYMICKIPGLGPLLVFVTHPILVVAAAFLFTAVIWVAIPMFTPAVWDGHSFKEALVVVYQSARSRLFKVIVMLVALYFITMLIGAVVVFGVLFGLGSMTTLASSILDAHVGASVLGSLMPMGGMGGYGGLGGYGGYGGGYEGGSGGALAQALKYSSIMIGAVLFSLMMQVVIMGLNLVYLSVTAGLDLSEGRAALDAGLEQARRKAKEAQERAKEAAERARQQARPATTTLQAPSAAQPTTPTECPNCHSPITADDLFCGNCGHKLK